MQDFFLLHTLFRTCKKISRYTLRLDAVEDLVSRFLMQFYKIENETFTRLESVESDMGLIIYPSHSIRSGKSVAELIKNFKGF